MGKNGKFGKDYGRVVGKDAKARPGWKGPGFVKKAEPSTKAKTSQAEKSDSIPEQIIPIELQQLLLNVFKNSFPEVLASDTLQPLLQDVKSALYERDFTRAFGREDRLEAYSIRWSPSRALCYTSILVDLRRHLSHLVEFVPDGGHPQPEAGQAAPKGRGGDSPVPPPATVVTSTLQVACFGGGAAEVIAFGGLLRFLQDSAPSSAAVANDESSTVEKLSSLSISDKVAKVDLLLIDTAQWQAAVHKLYQGLTTPPPLSKYASTSAKEANSSLIPATNMTATFRSEDLLHLSQRQVSDLVGKKQMLLTLLFTLNELYTASIAKTTGFLLNLTSAAAPGTLLLVVDSPSSYSETTVGSEAKKYPMKWLLDHTLLETEKTRGEETAANWEKIVSEDSQWFRLPETLHYPISLENMRYQVHLYRRM